MLLPVSWTIASAFSEALKRLESAETSHRQAEAEVEELIGRLLQLGRADLYLQRERPLSAEEHRALEGWIDRRLRGEPIQYITGRAAFRELDLAVTPAVLIPRPETELLVETVLEALRSERTRWPAPRVLDLGTGSGAIALAIVKEWPQARLTATDRSRAALEVAERNAAELGLEGHIRFLEGEWFEALPADERFEVVVSNPPYIADTELESLPRDVRDHEPSAALFAGPTGLEALRSIVDDAPRHLVGGGVLALELAESRAHDVSAWLEGAHDWQHVALRDDLAGRPRILLARRQTGPAIAPAQWGEDR